MTLLEFVLTFVVGWFVGVLMLSWRVRNLNEALRTYRRAERRRVEHDRRVAKVWAEAVAALHEGEN